MIHLLRLIRFPNLLIIIATQCLMRWAIVKPILKVNAFELQFSDFNFALLVLATVLLTAAGYVINDYFDTKTDILNRPETVIVGKTISRQTAMTLHIVFNAIAVLLGFYIAFRIHLYQLGFIFAIVTGILWYYSTTYKRQFLIGNIIVSLLTALVPLMVVLFEIPVLNAEYRGALLQAGINFNNIFVWVSGFAFFAFMTTLIREIIKDMEDFEGDSAYGRNTLPIVLGTFYTKFIILSLIGITLAALIAVYICFLQGNLPTLWYFLLMLILPLLGLAYKVVRASHKADYHFASTLTKFIMLFGLLYAWVVYYIFNAIFLS